MGHASSAIRKSSSKTALHRNKRHLNRQTQKVQMASVMEAASGLIQLSSSMTTNQHENVTEDMLHSSDDELMSETSAVALKTSFNSTESQQHDELKKQLTDAKLKITHLQHIIERLKENIKSK